MVSEINTAKRWLALVLMIGLTYCIPSRSNNPNGRSDSESFKQRPDPVKVLAGRMRQMKSGMSKSEVDRILPKDGTRLVGDAKIEGGIPFGLTAYNIEPDFELILVWRYEKAKRVLNWARLYRSGLVVASAPSQN